MFGGCCVVEGDGVAAGVGPDDADGGGAGLDMGSELELGEGDVGLEACVAVVGGVDAFASGQEGQPVGGVLGGLAAAVLAAGVGEDDFLVGEPLLEVGGGVGRGADGGVELSEEVATGAGEVVDGDGELGAVVMLDADAVCALGDWSLGVGQLAAGGVRGRAAAVGGGGGVLGGGAAGGGQGDLDASVSGAGLVAGVVDLGL